VDELEVSPVLVVELSVVVICVDRFVVVLAVVLVTVPVVVLVDGELVLVDVPTDDVLVDADVVPPLEALVVMAVPVPPGVVLWLARPMPLRSRTEAVPAIMIATTAMIATDIALDLRCFCIVRTTHPWVVGHMPALARHWRIVTVASSRLPSRFQSGGLRVPASRAACQWPKRTSQPRWRARRRTRSRSTITLCEAVAAH
jgi:hypothetical protein